MSLKYYLLAVAAALPFGLAAGVVATPFPEGRKAAVVFTFDDGTVDQYEVAAPVLDKYGIKAIFNIVPTWIGGKKTMTWEQVNDLVKRGHELANHTYSHKDLVGLVRTDRVALTNELAEGHRMIQEHTGCDARVVCLPFNRIDASVGGVVDALGYRVIRHRMGNWGEGFGAAEAHAFAEEAIRRGTWNYVLIHGVAPGGGWKAFRDIGQFEEIVKALKSHEELWIPGYAEAENWRNGYAEHLKSKGKEQCK